MPSSFIGVCKSTIYDPRNNSISLISILPKLYVPEVPTSKALVIAIMINDETIKNEIDFKVSVKIIGTTKHFFRFEPMKLSGMDGIIGGDIQVENFEFPVEGKYVFDLFLKTNSGKGWARKPASSWYLHVEQQNPESD